MSASVGEVITGISLGFAPITGMTANIMMAMIKLVMPAPNCLAMMIDQFDGNAQETCRDAFNEDDGDDD